MARAGVKSYFDTSGNLVFTNATGTAIVTLNQDGTVTFTGVPTLPTPAVTGDLTVTTGNVVLATAGKGLTVKEGTNARMGTLTLNGTTEVTVTTSAVTATSRIFLSANTVGGTPLGVAYVSARSAGVSFGVKGAATDTSIVAWMIVEPS